MLNKKSPIFTIRDELSKEFKLSIERKEKSYPLFREFASLHKVSIEYFQSLQLTDANGDNDNYEPVEIFLSIKHNFNSEKASLTVTLERYQAEKLKKLGFDFSDYISKLTGKHVDFKKTFIFRKRVYKLLVAKEDTEIVLNALKVVMLFLGFNRSSSCGELILDAIETRECLISLIDKV